MHSHKVLKYGSLTAAAVLILVVMEDALAQGDELFVAQLTGGS